MLSPIDCSIEQETVGFGVVVDNRIEGDQKRRGMNEFDLYVKRFWLVLEWL